MRASLLLSSIALTGSLLLLSGRAAAQVTDSTYQGKPELNTLPPDRPSLDAVPPPSSPPSAPTRPATPAPTPQDPGTFQPARPPQPRTLPPPAPRPAPVLTSPEAQSAVLQAAPRKSKWYVTGNPDLGLSSDNDYSVFNVGLSALFGYRITDIFAFGPGITYQYSSIKSRGASASYSNIGARMFMQALVTENIFIHAEAEALRTPPIDAAGYLDLSRRTTIYSKFAGLGYRFGISDDAAFDIIALYNFDTFENQFIYGQPEIRFNLLVDLDLILGR